MSQKEFNKKNTSTTKHSNHKGLENMQFIWAIRESNLSKHSTREEIFCKVPQFPEERPFLAPAPACALQTWTATNTSALYRCRRGSGDTSGSQSFPFKPRIEKSARQQNYKLLDHNSSRKHSALISIASSHPCYANPASCERWSALDRGPLWENSPSTFVFTAATSGEEITAKLLPLSRTLLGWVWEAEMQSPHARWKLQLLRASQSHTLWISATLHWARCHLDTGTEQIPLLGIAAPVWPGVPVLAQQAAPLLLSHLITREESLHPDLPSAALWGPFHSRLT